MISSVRGPVLDVSSDAAVIEVGGIGLSVQCTPPTLATLRRGEPATIHTSLIVREDSLTLYGFADADERAVFDVVQTVSGVGPRLAQGIVAALRPDALRQIVATEDVNALTQVPGIGKKGAQRLVLELKDKLGPAYQAEQPVAGGSGLAVNGSSTWRPQVHAALVGLGWTAREADAALVVVAEEHGEEAEVADVGVLLKTALRAMSPGAMSPGAMSRGASAPGLGAQR